jgi:hypothetical protein
MLLSKCHKINQNMLSCETFLILCFKELMPKKGKLLNNRIEQK